MLALRLLMTVVKAVVALPACGRTGCPTQAACLLLLLLQLLLVIHQLLWQALLFHMQHTALWLLLLLLLLQLPCPEPGPHQVASRANLCQERLCSSKHSPHGRQRPLLLLLLLLPVLSLLCHGISLTCEGYAAGDELRPQPCFNQCTRNFHQL
jgi:hypothetical protein